MPEHPNLQPPKCIACKEVIDADAALCSKCKSYQARWKNYLQYAASVVGIFTVLAALIVYIISKSPELKKVLFWSDGLQVISFAYPRDITIFNNGDGKILLLHIGIRTDNGATRTLLINKSLESGEVMTFELESEERNRLARYTVIPRLTPEEWNQKIYAYKSSADPEACVVYTVLHERDPYYLQYRAFYGEKFQTIGVKASLHFFSLRKRAAMQQFLPVHGLLLQNPDKNCQPH
jgi:hypothetical protein